MALSLQDWRWRGCPWPWGFGPRWIQLLPEAFDLHGTTPPRGFWPQWVSRSEGEIRLPWCFCWWLLGRKWTPTTLFLEETLDEEVARWALIPHQSNLGLNFPPMIWKFDASDLFQVSWAQVVCWWVEVGRCFVDFWLDDFFGCDDFFGGLRLNTRRVLGLGHWWMKLLIMC